MIVSEATLEDAPGIVRVWQYAFAERVKPETVLSKIGHPGYTVLIAADASEIVGFAIINLTAKGGAHRLDYMATNPLTKVRGAARALLTCMEARALSVGCKTLKLAVRRKNTRAHRVYLAAGYRVIDDRPAGFTMQKDL